MISFNAQYYQPIRKMRKPRLRNSKQLPQDTAVGKNRTWMKPNLSEAELSWLHQTASPCSPGLVSTAVIKCEQLIWFLLQSVPSALHTYIFSKTDFKKRGTIGLPLPASLMLMLEFLQKVSEMPCSDHVNLLLRHKYEFKGKKNTTQAQIKWKHSLHH